MDANVLDPVRDHVGSGSASDASVWMQFRM